MKYNVTFTTNDQPYQRQHEVLECANLDAVLDCYNETSIAVLDIEPQLSQFEIEMYLSMYRQDCDPRTPAQIAADAQDADYQDTIASARP